MIVRAFLDNVLEWCFEQHRLLAKNICNRPIGSDERIDILCFCKKLTAAAAVAARNSHRDTEDDLNQIYEYWKFRASSASGFSLPWNCVADAAMPGDLVAGLLFQLTRHAAKIDADLVHVLLGDIENEMVLIFSILELKIGQLTFAGFAEQDARLISDISNDVANQYLLLADASNIQRSFEIMQNRNEIASSGITWRMEFRELYATEYHIEYPVEERALSQKSIDELIYFNSIQIYQTEDLIHAA